MGGKGYTIEQQGGEYKRLSSEYITEGSEYIVNG